jgi:hypothetical protein
MIWLVSGLWWNYLKSGEKKSTSIFPVIPVIPFLFVCLASMINFVGLTNGVILVAGLNAALLLISFVVLAYAVIKTKNT